ncbi:polysaccharide deacetylase family protein [Mesoterricola silvestris]|uniref:Polysaccharide deacetylase n=1 Tax=Mesoterricola silvestris TaxID=2927979 RepID=A0AA48GI58_9BACT|nr:polysaccharide deacetylase family protein [Mesoterricola silvestris]BDU71439.1 polysaccharide deacetylase [Mesoterricola silvestris]
MRPFLFFLGFTITLSAQSIAFTFDDGPKMGQTVLLDAAGKNAAILGALREARVASCLFVAGPCLETPQGVALVKEWGNAGHGVANHGAAHGNLNGPHSTLAWFEADFLKQDARIRTLPGYVRWYRFPYLKEGDTREKRDGVRAFLKAQGCRNGHVTIDTSDWFYDQRLQQALARNPKLELGPWRKAYLDHLRNRAQYYDRLAQAAVGRSIPHVMLLHHNLTSALFLADAIRMFREMGWKVIAPAEAYADEVYRMEPDVLPAGESLVWSLAKAKGLQGLRFPGEDAQYEAPLLDALGL